MESTLEDESQSMRKRGLPDTGHILDEEVAPGENSDQRLFDHLPLAFDDSLNGFNQEADLVLWLNLWQGNPCSDRRCAANLQDGLEPAAQLAFSSCQTGCCVLQKAA